MRSGRARRGRDKETHASEAGSDAENSGKTADKERCPGCKDGNEEKESMGVTKEDWVRCDACKVWFHWRCVGDDGDLEAIDKWFCKPCQGVDPKRTITLKPPARKSQRKKPAQDYASLHNGVPPSRPDKWLAVLEAKEAAGAFSRDPFQRMKGSEVTLNWVENNPSALLEPIVVESPEGLGMTMPAPGLTVAEIAHLIGEDTPVEVMDVATQSNTPGYTLAKWAAYFGTPPESRDRIRNVISLEISDTPLGAQIMPPRLVRELDWVERFWPANKKGPGHMYPKVQLYCLMGVEKAWTDWHIDFAGSSVYYHIHTGAKTFYFIRPTPANLAAYERWSGSELQTSTWLGDLVDEIYKVGLTQGYTMIIPTGWIHAVYTPVDTLVFGGNFLHSYNVSTQLRIREIENSTRVPKKFQFPYFSRLCWYVAEASLRALKAREEFSPRVLSSLSALARFLVSEAHLIEHSDDGRGGKGNGSITAARRKEVKESVPADKVKDAPALARELRWRVRLAAHGSSDAEDEGEIVEEEAQLRPGAKRKRVMSSEKDEGELQAQPRFRHFEPKKWDAYQVRVVDESRVQRRVSSGLRLPEAGIKSETPWAEGWLNWGDEKEKIEHEESAGIKMEVDTGKTEEREEQAMQANVGTKREVMVRVRQTNNGLERQRIERTVENWEWA